MKITIVQGAFLPVPAFLGGAVEKQWFRLGQVFAAKGHEVVHVSRLYGELPSHEMIEGVRHVRIQGFDTPLSMVKLKVLDLIYSLRALRVIEKSDVIVTNTFWMPILLRFFKRGKPYVDVQRTPRGQMRYYLNAGRLRSNSRVVKKAILEECPQAAPIVSMIPNPLAYPGAAQLPDKSDQLILYTGRVHPEKGLVHLLNAFQLLVEQGLEGWRVEIVGPWDASKGGGGEAFLNELRGEFGGLDIEWLGLISDPSKLQVHYESAPIFVYPSVAEQGETFGVSPLEAMSWGAVPIVSALDCFKDFITDGQNGLVFDHRSAQPEIELAMHLRELIENPERRQKMALEALNVNKTHNTEILGEAFLEDFEAVLKAKEIS